MKNDPKTGLYIKKNLFFFCITILIIGLYWSVFDADSKYTKYKSFEVWLVGEKSVSMLCQIIDFWHKGSY